jgi:hypothetical protein
VAQTEQATDHRIWHVHQVGCGVLGGVILTFGVLGFVNRLDFFATSGGEVAGISSNGLLSTVSVVVGLGLIASAFAPRATSSWLATGVGALFIVAGFVNLALLQTSANLLAFEMPNVLFTWASGIALLALGLYGRASGGLDPDNPYQQKRDAAAAARRQAAAQREAERTAQVRERARRRAERRQRVRR